MYVYMYVRMYVYMYVRMYVCTYVCMYVSMYVCMYDANWGRKWWRSWLRHCAKSLKVAGSIPDGVIGIFYWQNPSGRTVVLRLTQPLTEMSIRNISWGKGGWCVRLTTLPPSCADCLEICEPQPPELSRPVQVFNGTALPFYLFHVVHCRFITSRNS